MSNSPLISFTRISPNHSGKRNHSIDTISIHCMAGDMSVESAGAWFVQPSTAASCNYCIGSDGRIGLIVAEENRSWCTSSASNDNRAITIEVANCGGAPDWPVTDKALDALVELLADICRRNGIPRLLWRGDKSLIGQVDKQNMTVHRWFKNKACPGDYLYYRHGEIAEKVNQRLEENHMNGEQILAALSDKEAYDLLMKAQRHAATLPEPGWSQKEGHWQRAVDGGIINGANPEGVLKRDELTAILGRKGLI